MTIYKCEKIPSLQTWRKFLALSRFRRQARVTRKKCHIYKHSTRSAPESFPPSKRMLEWQSRARMGRRIRHCNWRWLFEVFYFRVKWMIELNYLPTQRLRFGRLLDKTMYIIPTLEKQQDNVISLTSNVSPIPWKFKPDPPLPHNKFLNSEESILVWWLYYNPAELYLSSNPMKVKVWKTHDSSSIKVTFCYIFWPRKTWKWNHKNNKPIVYFNNELRAPLNTVFELFLTKINTCTDLPQSSKNKHVNQKNCPRIHVNTPFFDISLSSEAT